MRVWIKGKFNSESNGCIPYECILESKDVQLHIYNTTYEAVIRTVNGLGTLDIIIKKEEFDRLAKILMAENLALEEIAQDPAREITNNLDGMDL